jgi:hypothetical protein
MPAKKTKRRKKVSGRKAPARSSRSRSVGAHYRCVHVVKKVGMIKKKVDKVKQDAIKELEEQQGWVLAAMRHESNPKVKEGLRKREHEIHREILQLKK